MERFPLLCAHRQGRGGEIGHGADVHSHSPVHTDEHWGKSRMIADSKDCIDRIMVEDASGVLNAERTRT